MTRAHDPLLQAIRLVFLYLFDRAHGTLFHASGASSAIIVIYCDRGVPYDL